MKKRAENGQHYPLYANDRMKNKYLLAFARALPYLLIVAYIAGLSWSIATGKYNFAISGSILAIPALAAATALLHIYRCDPNTLSEFVPLFPFKQKTLVILFGVAFSLTIVLGLFCPVESPFFLGGIVALYTIILLQIFSEGHRPTIVLTEIVLAMACLIYETTLKYPYYFGDTDILPHVFWSTVTYVSGHVVPPDLSPDYAYFPLYHIWLALSSHVLALGIKPTLFLITCPVYVMVTVCLFYLFKQVTGNVQISLLACLLYSIDPIVTSSGTYVVTRTAAYIGFAILLYLLITSNSGDSLDKKGRLFRAFAILMTVYILLVHHVSTPQILFLLLLLLGCEWFIGSKKHLHSSFFVLVVALFLAYWFYVAFDFAYATGASRLRPDILDTPVVRESLQPYAPLAFLINNVDTLIFLFFAIIGICYLLWKQKPAYASVFGLFALLTIVLYVPTPIQTLWQTIQVFAIYRFKLLVSPFMAFVMSWGLHKASGCLQAKIPVRVTGSVVLLLFVVYCCVATGIIMEEEYPESRVSFTSEELDGFDHVHSHAPYGTTIHADYYTSRYFTQSYFTGSEDLGLPFYHREVIRSVTDIPSYQGLVIIPRKQFMGHGLRFSKGGELDPEGGFYPYLPSNETISTLSNSLAGKNKIYSSESIELYHS